MFNMVVTSNSVILLLALTVPIIAVPNPYQSSTCPDTKKCLDGSSPRCRQGGNRCEYERCYDGSYAPCSVDGPIYPQSPLVTQCQDRRTCPDGSSPRCRPGGNPCEWQQCYDGYNWAPCTAPGGNSWGGQQYSPAQPPQPPPQPYQPPPPQNGPQDTYQRQGAGPPPQGYGNLQPPPPPNPPLNNYQPIPNNYQPPPNNYPPPPSNYQPPPNNNPGPSLSRPAPSSLPSNNNQPPPNNYQPPPSNNQPPPNNYQPPPVRPNSPPQDPYAHAADNNQTSCPAACNTQYNYCDKTTAPSCVPATLEVYNPRPYCACRPGYKATGIAESDTTKQWRLPVQGQQHRVWVAEGVRCDTVCTGSGVDACKEIPIIGGHCIG